MKIVSAELIDHDSDMRTPATSVAVPSFAAVMPDAEAIFSVLNSSKRRRILVALTDGEGMSATQLAPLVGRSQDGALKHLIELRAAGLLRMAKDPNDHRRQLYSLTAAVQVIRHESGVDLDFGCCVWRVR